MPLNAGEVGIVVNFRQPYEAALDLRGAARVLPYWILFLVWMLYALAFKQRLTAGGRLAAPPRLSFALVGMALLTAAMIGFRFKVGGDWRAYIEIYNLIQISSYDGAIQRIDPAYGSLVYVASHAGWPIWTINLICGVIMMLGIARFCSRQANPPLSLLIAVPYLIIVIGMGYTRQGVAIGILMAGLADFNGRHVGRLLLYGLAAALFHKTALLVLPLVLWPLIQHNRLYAIVSAAVFATLFYFLLRGATDALITNYVESSAYRSSGAAIRVMMNVAPAIAVLAFGRKLGFTDYQSKMWRVFAVVSLATVPLVLLASFSTAIDRLALFLIPLQVAVLPRLPYAFGRPGKPNPQVMAAVVSYSAAVQLVWLVFATHARYWVPYQAFFFNA